MEIMWYVLKTQ